MNKRLTLIIVLVVILLGIVGLSVNFYKPKNTQAPSRAVFDPLNATYTIENVPVTLVKGKSVVATGNTKVTTSIFGEPVSGDINGDGIPDAAMLLSQDTGGSGLFYYIVALISTANNTHGTNAVFIGDRIAPQNIEINNTHIVANYADRKPGEPMTNAPSVGVSMYLVFDGGKLNISAAPLQTISYLVSTADQSKYCNGIAMDSTGYKKTITLEKTTSTLELNQTKVDTIRAVIHAATTGMCQNVLSQLGITESSGTVTMAPIDAWVGSSIAMCSCKPEVEVNLLRMPGISKVVWSTVENFGNEQEKMDLIRLKTPLTNQIISSPLSIKGEARGSWFFEGSFPVVLIDDWDGKIIAQGIATATGEWMTNEFVPFEATLIFTLNKNSTNSNGKLMLRKDNPSGLPEHDDELEVPIQFLTKSNSPVVCTQDVKQCSDGSYVARTGPSCEFAACPSESSQ